MPRTGSTVRREAPLSPFYDHGIWYTYVLGSLAEPLYIGFTGQFERHVLQRREGIFTGFTGRAGVDRRLLYYESFDDPLSGIAREKQLKGWTRKKMVALIETMNPSWQDLSWEWYEDVQRRRERRQMLGAQSARVR